ncbi:MULTISPECIES: glutaredoxin 3 [unclassified Acinetobacter]|uniref:glutaredoxin 3 n=1 Tax=unclassified Acinetobacter TaxID=196816 RepID=UPI0035B9A1E7
MTVKVKLYTTPTCPYCIRAKQLLQQKGIAFDDTDLTTEDSSVRAELTARTGQRTVPYVFVNDQFIGGSDDLHALARTGELDKLLSA